MNESPDSDGRPGGTVQPLDRVAVMKARFQAPDETPARRYELRDPFAEVVYRSRSFDDMVAKAAQLGVDRFTAVDPDGARTQVRKRGEAWIDPEPPQARGPAHPDRNRDDPPRSAAVVTLVPPATQPAPAAVARVDAEAERAAEVARLEAALNERYVVKRPSLRFGDVALGQTEYRFRGDTTRVAFTETPFRLATDQNSPSVARSMVDLAQARSWQSLRVSGHDDFRRMVWLEAAVRGLKTLGYEPVPGDLELLRREREARQVNRIDRAPADDATNTAGKGSARGSGGRKAVLAALEAVLVARRVPDPQREALMAAAAEQLTQRSAAGQVHKVKVYDQTAPSQRPAVTPTREAQRTRERAAPVR
jgi:hypothetical protein